MDGFGLIAALVKAIAWPVTFLITLAMLRPILRTLELKELIARTLELKFPGGSIKFHKGLESAKETVDKIEVESKLPRPKAPTKRTVKSRDKILQIAEKFPEAAVFESFIEVEQTLIGVAKEIGIDTNRSNIRVLGDILVAKDVIGPDISALLDTLRSLRNNAVHNRDRSQITGQQAIDYREQCKILITLLQNALSAYKKRKPPEEHATIEE